MNANLTCAIIFEKHEFNYSQINEMNNSLVFYLRENAVMKVGDAFVYINPRYPEERKKYLVSEVKAKLVLKYLSTPQNLFDSLDIFEYDLDNHDYHLYDNNLPVHQY
ncbi:hypothetical protein U3516DRAFT_741783 [Neocallimastix sp. 'constans']